MGALSRAYTLEAVIKSSSTFCSPNQHIKEFGIFLCAIAIFIKSFYDGVVLMVTLESTDCGGW